MEISKDKYSITELSERLNVTDHTLRYYEKEFGIYVPKDERGRRCYSPELANLLYNIKNMRDEGLEIKAIKKILQSESTVAEPRPIVVDETAVAVIAAARPGYSGDLEEIKEFFVDFRDQLSENISSEVSTARDQLSRELIKTKLELGACIENGMRKLESKMEKHFQEVDRSIGLWRERNNRNPIKRLLKALK